MLLLDYMSWNRKISLYILIVVVFIIFVVAFVFVLPNLKEFSSKFQRSVALVVLSLNVVSSSYEATTAVVSTTTLQVQPQSTSTLGYVLGDVNSDKTIGSNDVDLLIKTCLPNHSSSLNCKQGDMNFDGKIDDKDVQILTDVFHRVGESIPPVPGTENNLGLNFAGLLPGGFLVDTFSNQFNLLYNKYKLPNGDWLGDMQNDATSFSPELMFKIYKQTGRREFYNSAMATVGYEKVLVKGLLNGTTKFSLDILSGFDSFIACSRYGEILSGKIECRLIAGPSLSLASDLLLKNITDKIKSEDLGSWMYSAMVWKDLEYYQITGQDKFRDYAVNLMKKNENQYYDSVTGLFKESGNYSSYDEPAGLIAYAKLYEVTKDDVYLKKAEKMITTLLEKRVPQGSFSTFAIKDVRPNQFGQINSGVYLSSHMQYVRAFLILYQGTKDIKYKNFAHNFLVFASSNLDLEKLSYHREYNDWAFPGQKNRLPFFAHDISILDTSLFSFPEARIYMAPSNDGTIRYCTGCAFFILNIIFDYNNLT